MKVGMTRIHLGRSAIIVEEPPQPLIDGLKSFDHKSGTYKELYFLSETAGGRALAAPPGFADLAMRLCGRARVLDERVPMPKPDYAAAEQGLTEPLKKAVRSALEAGGGMIAMPSVCETHKAVAALLKAFPRDALLERGTPLSVVISPFRNVCHMASLLRKELPERELGSLRSRELCESEDIIVTDGGCVRDVPADMIGFD